MKYPDELNERFDEPDHIRKIVKTDEVFSVRKSLERATPGHSDALIVIIRNSTETDQLSVWRYWWRAGENDGWIQSEYLFDFEDKSWEQVDIFDDYAMAYKDQEFWVLLFKEDEAKGTLLPDNFALKAYTWTQSNSAMEAFTYHDMSGIKGEWEIIALIKYDGSMALTPIAMVISPSKDNYSARFSPDTSF